MKKNSINRWTALFAAFVASALTAEAATITVVVKDDNNVGQPVIVGSLRAAVAAANAGDTITFDPSLDGQNIQLHGGQIILNTSLTIQGLETTHPITITGNNDRLFDVAPGVTATISELTLSNGQINGTGVDVSGGGNGANGGAILNSGTLTLTDDALTNNQVKGNGGAILNANGATLNVYNSTFTNNQAEQPGGSSLPVSGGAIADQGGSVLISGCTFQNNHANQGSGGAIYEAGTLTVVNSTFFQNQANNGTGGAIADSGSATIAIYDSTFTKNQAKLGGGLGIQAGVPSWSLANSIIAYNQVSGGGSSGPDIYVPYGVPISLGYNIIGSTQGTFANNFTTGDQLNVPNSQLNLQGLAYNGGETFTCALKSNSVAAINAGNPALIPPGVTTDQRGYPRTTTSGQLCIGAFQFTPGVDKN